MKVEVRQFLVSRNPVAYRKMLVLIAVSEDESKMIDDVIGCKVQKDELIGKVQGEVKLSDGYGEHYIRLERVE